MTHVDFETAKILKEVGYSGDCTHCYMHGELQDEPLLWQYHDEDYFHPAPDLNTASDWIRDVHGLHIWTEYIPQALKCWLPYIMDLKSGEEIVWDEQPEVYCLPTHPAALAAAIKKACWIVKERKLQ